MMDLKPYLPHSFVTTSDQHEGTCYPESMSGYAYHSYSHHSHYSSAYPVSQSSWTPEYSYPYTGHAAANDWDEYRTFYPPSSVSPESSCSLGQPYPDSTGLTSSTVPVTYEESDTRPSYQDLRRTSPPAIRFQDAAVSDRKISDAMPTPKKKMGQPGTGRKERRRTISLNSAFSTLRARIPKVPVDTKLSKIKTLRLASLYIQYLNKILNGPQDGPQMQPNDFEVDLHQFKRNRSSTRCSAAAAAASSIADAAATSSRILPSPSSASTTSCSTTASSESLERMTQKGSRKAVDGTMLERKAAAGSGHHHQQQQDPHYHQVGKGRTGWSEAVWKEQVRSGASSSLQQHPSFVTPSHVSCLHHPNQLHQHQEHLQPQQVALPAYIN